MENIIFKKDDLKVISLHLHIHKQIPSLKKFLYLLQHKLENNNDNQDRLEVIGHSYIKFEENLRFNKFK